MIKFAILHTLKDENLDRLFCELWPPQSMVRADRDSAKRAIANFERINECKYTDALLARQADAAVRMRPAKTCTFTIRNEPINNDADEAAIADTVETVQLSNKTIPRRRSRGQ